jgi:TRAP-type C4-dicarboxylate transport system permease small subunit
MRAFALYRAVNRLVAQFLQRLLVGLFSMLVVVVLWGVVSRYVLGDQASWSEELARLLMVWLALLGAALVCREEKHLGLDVVVRSWPAPLQRLARIFGYVAILVFAALIMGWGGWQIVEQRFASGQKLPALEVSRAWFYLALPVSGVLTTAFMAEALWVCLRAEPSGAGTGEWEADQ